MLTVEPLGKAIGETESAIFPAGPPYPQRSQFAQSLNLNISFNTFDMKIRRFENRPPDRITGETVEEKTGGEVSLILVSLGTPHIHSLSLRLAPRIIVLGSCRAFEMKSQPAHVIVLLVHHHGSV